jgi:hypothetical protein
MSYLNNLLSSTRLDVLAGFNLGSETLTLKLPIGQFIDLSEVPNEGAVGPDEVAQRVLDRAHAQKLAVYVLKGLISTSRNLRRLQKKGVEMHEEILGRLGAQPYYSLQPIVVNIPIALADLDPQVQKNMVGDDLTVRIRLPVGTVMWVIDGQHRRWAMNLVLEFLRYVLTHRSYPKKGSLYPAASAGTIPPEELEVWRDAQMLALQHCTVSVEAHVGLDTVAQRQLFHDLNNMGKSVSASMAFDFDNSNPINLYIKDVLIEGKVLKAPVSEKDISDWSSHDGSMARKDIVAVNSILFLNKTNPKGASPVQVERMEEVATKLWSAVSGIKGFGEPGAKLKTVAAQPVVLKALAKLVYDFAVGRKADERHLQTLLDGIGTLDFSHANPMWRYYEMSREERARLVPGLSDYLPDDEGNRDVGGTDEEGRMRFGAKHNDIYPILGDMVRWKLGLPSRQADDEVAVAE